MKYPRILFFLFCTGACLLISLPAFAQRGKNLAKTIATPTTVVNEYTSLTADAVAGASTLTVTASAMNANNRFGGPLAAGDLILIIQLQGAAITGAPPTQWDPFSEPRDSTWGAITNYNNCGNWEFAEVYDVPSNGTTITLDCPLTHSYTAAGKVVVVRVPRYSSLTINSGASITCDPWNGTIGGICAIEVQNNTTINGSIDVTGKGFRGGALHSGGSTYGVGEAASLNADYGAEKGEGIAGFQADYDVFGGRYCAGAPANGGGGGDSHNAAGAGGANAGDPNAWDGHGNPDLSGGAGWVSAWNLQYSGFANNTSSGGGQGGYSFSYNNSNPTTTGPGNTAWKGDNRRKWGGFGGRPLDYSTGRLFLGGGGGAGDQDDGKAAAGANGGALVYLMNYGTIGGTGTVVSNGSNGANSGIDGGGGGGGGGTVMLNSVGAISGISITANGGTGGNQVVSALTLEGEGPGGGGGGGYIAISNGAPARTANGGANGTTNAQTLTKFPPNGATKGGAGTSNATVTNFTINSPSVTVCGGQSATLTASLTGTPPGGATITWYDSIVAGNTLGTGSPYITPVLSPGTYTFYVGTCPGTYRQPVVVTVTNSPVVSAGPDATMCPGGNVTLSASGGTGYVWSPATGLSNPNISNPVAAPAATTTYVCTVTAACGNANDTVVVTVNSGINASISGNTTVCSGGSTTLTASGGTAYSWSTNATTSSIVISPTANTNYSVMVSNGNCSGTASVTVTIGAGIAASITGNTTVCAGGSTTLTATGGNSYSWNTNATTSSIVISPTTNTNYSVTVSSGNCSGTASVTVTVGSGLTASISGNTTVCAGGSTTLTASGGNLYSWNTNETTSSIVVSPTATTGYSVLVSNGNCSGTASVTVTSSSGITASVTGNTIICAGGSSTLTASGGTSYLWSTGNTGSTLVVTPGSTTTYSVTASNGSCSSNASITVNVGSSINASVSGKTVLCGGGSTTLTASGGTGFSWSTGATTASVIISAPGNYSVTVSSGICSSTTSVSVSASPLMQVQFTTAPVQCGAGNGSATASVTGGTPAYTYSWNPTGQTAASATGLTAGGIYTTTITDAAGCTLTSTVNVAALNAPAVTISGNTQLCNGDAATLTASGGNTYSWSNGSGAATIAVAPSATTTYTVISYVGNCSDTGQVTVTVNAPPVAGTSGNTTICKGKQATLTATGGGNYSWSTGATTPSVAVSPTSNASYSVVVSVGSCADTASVSVTVVPAPVPAVAASKSVICSGEGTTLTASGGGTYSWSTGNTTAAVSVAPGSTTVYTVTVTNSSGCTAAATATITVTPSPPVTILGNTNLCPGNTATLTATGGGTYSWSSGETTAVIHPAAGGSYSVVVTNNSCTAAAVTNVTVRPDPIASAGTDVTILIGQNATLSAAGGTSYTWDNGGGNSQSITVSPAGTTRYCVTVMNAYGCKDTACVNVTVESCAQAGTLYLPNAFSPNSDGDNDSLQIYYSVPACIKSFHLAIFGRWGDKVYETEDPAFKWGGTSGTHEGTQVFAYYMIVEIMDGSRISQKGNITLIR